MESVLFRFKLFFLACVCLALPALAQPHVKFRRLTLTEGLSQNSPLAIYQDNLGYIWIGTQDGLNRYDGYSLKIYQSAPDDPHTLSGSFVPLIAEDLEGQMWVGEYLGTMERYDPTNDRFDGFPQPASLGQPESFLSLIRSSKGALILGTHQGSLLSFDPTKGSYARIPIFEDQPKIDGSVYILLEDKAGTFWLGSETGLFSRPLGQTYFQPFVDTRGRSLGKTAVRVMCQDHLGRLWVGAAEGLYYIESAAGGDRAGELSSCIVPTPIYAILEDHAERIWLGSRTGLYLLDRESETFQNYHHLPNDASSLGSDKIMNLFEDRNKLLWISTNGAGVNIFNPTEMAFNFVKAPDAWALQETPDGSILIGTNGEGLQRLNPETGEATVYKHDPNDPTSLVSDDVRAIIDDGQGRYWVATFGGGLGRFGLETQKFERWTHDDNDPMSLSDNALLSLYTDQRDQLWVGTSQGGLNLLMPDGKHFQRYRYDPQDPNSICGDKVWDITSSADGTLWVASFNGLNAFDQKTDRWRRFQTDPEDPRSISGHGLFAVLADSKGRIWAGGLEGLNLLEPDGVHFRHFRRKDGLLSEYTYGILEDNQGFLWLSSTHGLSRLDPETGAVRSYLEGDGLQSNEFNAGAAFKSAKGRLYFAGINGFNAFYPEQVVTTETAPQLVITKFLLRNKIVVPQSKDPNSPMPVAADRLRELSLAYKEYLFGFEFAALNFVNPAKNRYAYRLEGLDREWIETDGLRPYATYTHLAPGHYVFKVKAAQVNGPWSDPPVSIDLRVRPPIWMTWWAYALYILGGLGLLALFWRNQTQKLVKERNIAERLRQVDKLKDEFLANTSHELRTPLNGIIGIAETLAEGVTGPVNDQMSANLKMIVSSGKRLSALVDDILDFAKLRDHKLQLRLAPVDMGSLTNLVLALLRPLVGHRPVRLCNEIPGDCTAVLGDENRIQQILHNLVGNAVKFTDSGSVVVTAQVQEGFLAVSISDTGPGIPDQDKERIFESFQQVDGGDTRVFGGTGLGLALTRQLVQLHGGSLSLDSHLGQGSCFTFTLPISDEAAPVNEAKVAQVQGLGDSGTWKAASTDHLFSVLVVDDEPVNRQVLCNHLAMLNYEVWEAGSGAEALALASEQRFDLVLLDVMMPRMNGYEVCRALRVDHPIHELPILFLTARNQVADLKVGFEAGGNDFLTKPVSKDELLSRIRAHLELLDINRHLEERVSQRTQELECRNLELEQRNQEILRTRDQLIFSEKMASLGTLTAGIAHEIRNPLMFVTGFAEVVSDLSEELRTCLEKQRTLLAVEDFCFIEEHLCDLGQNTEKITEHSKRANQIVQNMIVLARSEDSVYQKVKINQITSEFCNLGWKSSVPKSAATSIRLIESFDPEAGHLVVFPKDLGRALINLVSNSVEAINQKLKTQADFVGELQIGTRRTDVAVRISIRDNGVGMSQELRAKALTPFFTTKIDAQNLGLGLSRVYEIIVNEHGGQMEIHSEEGEFTEVILHLPIKEGT